MTRMIDLILRSKVDWMPGIVRHAQPFIVDNVQRYMTTDPNQHYGWEDFPNLAPPFGHFWMEYEAHNGSVPQEGQTYHMQSGVAVRAAWLPEHREDLLEQCGRSENGASFRRQMEEFLAISEDPRWLLDMIIFDRRSDRSLTDDDEPQLMARCNLSIKADGSFASKKTATTLYQNFGDIDITRYIFAGLAPFLMAISFMHCKNVIQVDRQAPRAERRRADREKILPPVTYKTLVIEPMTKVLHTEGGRREGESIKRAMHICRGHFKTFDEKPLFGKHRGMYFWNDQVRSRTSDRAVAKRYDIHPARDESGILTSAETPDRRIG